MNAPPHLQRALLLQEQNRHSLAEHEIRQHLSTEPNDGFAHAALALSLLELKRLDEAEAAAKEAIGHTPDLAFAHYALARVLSERNRDAEAIAEINEALRLEPADADYHGLKAAISFDRRQWKEALNAADAGLEHDPEHVACNNIRAMALTQLGRRDEAGATLDSTLSRAPENSFSHANKGWALLHAGDRRQAMVHFRESLRLDPNQEWARAGLVEALKAGNPLYALMLKYFLWMGRLSMGAQWAIIMGGWLGNRLLGSLAASNPALAPWVWPLRILYLTFVLLTWLANPLCNLMLRLHPEGKYALSDEQKASANWIGATLGLALASLLVALASGQAVFLIAALVFGLLALPLAGVFRCAVGWPRRLMTFVTVALALLGAGIVLLASGYVPPVETSVRSALGLLGVYALGCALCTWLVAFLGAARPER